MGTAWESQAGASSPCPLLRGGSRAAEVGAAPGVFASFPYFGLLLGNKRRRHIVDRADEGPG